MAVWKSRRHVRPWWENEKMTLRLSKKKRTEFLVTFSSPFFCTIFAAFFTFLALKTVQKFCGKMDKRNAVIFLLCFTIGLKKIYKFHLENFFVRHIILGLFIKNVTNIEKCCFPWKRRQSVEIESGIQPGPGRIAPLKVGRWSGNPIGIRLETSRCFGRIPAMESGGKPVG